MTTKVDITGENAELMVRINRHVHEAPQKPSRWARRAAELLDKAAATLAALEAGRDEARERLDTARATIVAGQKAYDDMVNMAADWKVRAEAAEATANARVKRLEKAVRRAIESHWQDEADNVRDEMMTILSAALTGAKSE